MYFVYLAHFWSSETSYPTLLLQTDLANLQKKKDEEKVWDACSSYQAALSKDLLIKQILTGDVCRGCTIEWCVLHPILKDTGDMFGACHLMFFSLVLVLENDKILKLNLCCWTMKSNVQCWFIHERNWTCYVLILKSIILSIHEGCFLICFFPNWFRP